VIRRRARLITKVPSKIPSKIPKRIPMVAALACAALAVWSIAGPGPSAAWAQGPDAAMADEMCCEIR
jgi:hypothetical protein